MLFMFVFSMVSSCNVIHFIFFWSMVMLRTTDGGSVTWYEPPPVETTSDHEIELIADSRQFLEGSTRVQLSWNFSLTPDLSLNSVALYLNGVQVAGVAPSTGIALVLSGFEGRFNITWISQRVTLIVFNVTEEGDGEFDCRLATLQVVTQKEWRRKVKVEVVVPVKLTDVRDRTVLEGSNTTLFCDATGKPTPSITLTRVLEDGSDGEVLPQGSTSSFPNINRTASGTYRCAAENEYETAHRVFKVNVTYPAKIVKLVSEHEVSALQSVSLDCRAEGNPQPTYTWTPCDPQQSVCHQSVLHFRASNKSVYTFTCKVANYLANDTGNTTLFIASDVINVTLVVIGVESNKVLEKLRETLKEIFAGKLDYESVEQKNIRETTKNSNGVTNVIVNVAMKFSSTVRESEVLFILRDAANSGGFGDFNVSSITGTRDTGTPATMTTTPIGSPDSTTWIIVGVVLGVVAALAVAGGVAWYVHKKRKCKKRDPKVHNNGSQGEAGGNVQDEGYVEVNKGYDSRANRQSGGGNTASVPAVLYDTARTGNRGAVKEPALPQYAVVDKSKKKPKKPKPGELQYAELAEFSAGQGGQRSSTSPTNRPAEIQYADVNAM